MEAGGKRHIIHRSRSDQFRIWNIADIHLGNAAVAKDRLHKDIKEIANDPFSFWFGGGDYGEFISPADKRWDAGCVSKDYRIRDLGSWGSVIMAGVADLLRPIKHKCLGMLYGNHEDKHMKLKECDNLHGWLCTELGAQDLGYSCLIDVTFLRLKGPDDPILLPKGTPPPRVGSYSSFRFFLHHGAGAAQTPGGKMNRLVQFMQDHRADVYMVGHCHDQIGKRITELCADATCSSIQSADRVGVMTGSYLRTYAQGVTTYGEIRGYRPVPLGARFVTIDPETRDIRAEV